MTITWHVILLGVAVIINAVLTSAVALRLQTIARVPIALGLGMCAAWAATYGAELMVPSPEFKELMVKGRAVFMSYYMLVWFEAAFRFTLGRRVLHGWRLAAVMIVPTLTVIFTWWPDCTWFRSNYRVEFNGSLDVLVFDKGPWTAVHAVHNFGLMLIVARMLVRTIRDTPWESRGRLLLIACAACCFVTDALYIAQSPIVRGVNYTPIALSGVSLAVAVALFRWQMIDLAPVARAMLIENLEDAIFVLGRNDQVVDLNRAATTLLGLRPEVAIGTRADRLFDQWPDLRTWLVGRSRGATEIRQTGLFYEASLLPIAGPGGRTLARILVLRDVTRRRQVEDELRLARDNAEAADRAKSRFLAMMSHEIRTPMNGVVGFAQLLQGTSLTPEQREYADFIVGSGESLLVIIDDVLDYSKISAGRLEIERTAFRPRDLLERVAQLFRPRFEAKGLALRWTTDAAIPATVLGDPVRIEQILSNLVGNALKFTERGSVSIHLALAPDTATDGRLTLAFEVTDTGIGIAADVLERLFRPFGQADTSITRRYGGTGLGLVIARRLCELMEGTIEVRSQPGQGSTFTALVRVRNEGPDSTAVPPAGPPAIEGRPLHVLVCEDNAVNQHLISVMLRKLGHTFELAASGAAGLVLLKAGRFDAILMDVEMPDIDGFETLRRLRAQEDPAARNYVIAVTAHALHGERERCLAAGMDDYLAKPYTRESLRAALLRVRLRSTPGSGRAPSA